MRISAGLFPCGPCSSLLLPRPVLLRLRGAGITEASVVCEAHQEERDERSPAPHELTRKMETVWCYADALRQQRKVKGLTTTAPDLCESGASAHSTGDGDAYDEVRRCRDDTEAECMLQKLQCLLQDPSALLRHEVCYAMGQTGLDNARPVLASILQNARSALYDKTRQSRRHRSCE